MLKNGDKIGIVCCSNGQISSYKPKIDMLCETLKTIGLIPICSNYIFEKSSAFSGTGEERGNALMSFYKDDTIKAIFDISGGDLANEVLDYIDFETIKNNPKPFFGYSDLTTIINAIYAKTHVPSYLYQIRNLIYNYKDIQISDFTNSILHGKKDLFNIEYKFFQGEKIHGTLIGGNIRCFLKLSGTPYMPSFKDKILFLESLGGEAPLILSYLTQLKHLGAFNEVSGILLGTFTKLEENPYGPSIHDLIKKVVNNPLLPIAKTPNIGHGNDSKCLIIGKEIHLSSI